MRVLRLLWRLLRALLLGLAALVVFIEEFGWRPLSAWLGRIAEWPPLHALLSSNYVRGAVSGLGIVNVLAAVGEIAEVFDGRPGSARVTPPTPPASPPS